MIAIIDYGMGNLASVYNAFVKIGETDVKITSDPGEVTRSDKMVLPGVGAFEDAMKNLSKSGLIEPIVQGAQAGKPFLGICLGYQLIFERSYENGNFAGLGLLAGDVVRFQTDMPVPHMGWNQAKFVSNPGIFESLPSEVYFYFCHAYYPVPAQEEVIVAYTEYGNTRFASVVRKGNVFATQFHPEKSHEKGLQIIEKFARL